MKFWKTWFFSNHLSKKLVLQRYYSEHFKFGQTRAIKGYFLNEFFIHFKLILISVHFILSSRPMNGYIPSYFSSFSQPNMFGRLNGGVSNNSQQTNNLKANQVTATHLSGQGHRRLPATPNKPSTLFTQTASMAFQNFSHQFTKPSSLMIRYVN